ncbi:MAG TPA: sigma-70 family RNA polymerase sigma factor [Fimbriiglobus sp.]|nr:sigma-70 family RNA polymerase sigma factor [Fimbriiglobus sp.]
MADETDGTDDLARRAAAGDPTAWQGLIAATRDRLRRMVQLRLNRRLQGRVDADDVLQEAYLEMHRQIPGYAADPGLPFFLWARHLTGLKLAEVHRRHLGTQMRDAAQEVTLHRGGVPEADSASLAARLMGALTSPSQAAVKAEMRLLVQDALVRMDPLDREVLALKHFEQLSLAEMAEVLGMSKAGVGHRYLKAIKRLRDLLEQTPGFPGL